MKNFEKLQSKNIDDLAEWLDTNAWTDTSPWLQWWGDTYCNHCESIMCKYGDGTREFPVSWCELYGKCKFFQEMNEVPSGKEIVKMWLESEAEE